jgi:ice-binding like protein
LQAGSEKLYVEFENRRYSRNHYRITEQETRPHLSRRRQCFSEQPWKEISTMKRPHFGFLPAFLGFALLFAALPALPQTAPPLGAAATFSVLGGSTVTNTGPTVVTGDLGVSPGSAITGFPPGIVVGGSTHAADALAAQAQIDATTAYNNLAAQACTTTFGVPTDLGGMTLLPGVYCFASSAAVTGTLLLNANGNPNAVFVFKTGSTFVTASGATITVIGGGQNCNVFWQVGSSATLGTTSTVPGTIIALTSITLTTGANLSGRSIARNGAVTLDSNAVSGCAAAAVAAAGGPTLDFFGLAILMILLVVAGLFVMNKLSM